MANTWVPLSLITTVCNAFIPTFTPVLNQYAYGASVVSTYFIGSAIVSIIGIVVSILVGGNMSFVLPSMGVLFAGVLYGAGTLSIQKAVERAPTPALATVLPRNRAMINGLFAFGLFGVLTLFRNLDIYALQSVLVVVLLVLTKSYNSITKAGYSWQMYSFLSMLLLGFSDVLVKHSVGLCSLLTNITWFSLAGSLIPGLVSLRQSGSYILKYREESREDAEGVPLLTFLITAIFAVKVISQYAAISLAPDSASIRLVGSFAVPLTAFVSNALRGIQDNPNHIFMYILFLVSGLIVGVRSIL